MRITRNYLLVASSFASIIRFLVFPIDDYPDIFYIYKLMINKETYFSVAKFFNFFDLFESYSCSVLKPKEPFLTYVIGGGVYKCENFPLSFTYFYFFIGIFLIFLLLVLFFYKISFNLPDSTKKLFRTTILNLILLPSTTFFLLSLHIDVPYHFLTLSFILTSFYLAFQRKLKLLFPLFIIPYILLINLAPDNQSIVFAGLLVIGFISNFLSKKEFILRLFNNASLQFVRILAFKPSISKKVFFNLFLVIVSIVLVINYYSFDFLELLAKSPIKISELQDLAIIHTDPDNVLEYSQLEKYPFYLRILNLFQGIIISSPFGIRPSIVTTLFFFVSFFIGFLRTFSLKNNVFPVFIKIFLILSFLMMTTVVAIFPFFSNIKYWLYFSPFAALFMSFAPRISLISFLLIYAELLLKSNWISF